MNTKHFFLCSWRGHKFTRKVKVGAEIVNAPLFACDCCGRFNPHITIPRAQGSPSFASWTMADIETARLDAAKRQGIDSNQL